MASLKIKKQKSPVQLKMEKTRKKLWPDVSDEFLWDYHNVDGWLTIPRSMPLILLLINQLSEKGKPLSSIYFEIFCRHWDTSFVIANDQYEMACYSGFTGERAINTWRDRVKTLAELGFIKVKPKGINPYNYILIPNPHLVIISHFDSGKINKNMFEMFDDKLTEIGCKDIENYRKLKIDINSL